jgi:hypothetical protein
VRTVTYSGVIEVHHCSACGVPFGLDRAYADQRRQDRASFRCPNGHGQWFPGSTAEEREKRLQELLNRERSRATAIDDQRQAAERSARAYKGQATKIRRRVAKGVCPCCNRSFADLRRHMEGQHPDYAQEIQ